MSPNELFVTITGKDIADVEHGSYSVELLDKVASFIKI